MRADQTASLKPEALAMDSSGDAGMLSVNVNRLKRLSSQFAEIDRITEESFLALGRHVIHFQQRAGEISASTVDALQLLEGASGEQALMRLQLLIERCSLWLDDAQSQTSQIIVILENIVSRMSRMTTPLQGLRKLVKALQGLRISTRIETARAPGSGAQILADELKRLTEMIQDKVQQIEQQFDSLGALSSKMLEHQKQIRTGAMEAAQRGIQENRHTLSCLSGQRVETGYRTEQLQSQSDKVAAHFGEMIIALQFQDITRQRLEHIQHALEDLSSQVGLQSQASDLGNEEALLITGEVCRLQQEHLEQVLTEFDAAVDSLMLNLNDVVASVSSLTDETRRFDTASREIASPEQSSNVALLKKVTDQLGVVLDLHMEARSTIRTVCGKVDEISSQVDAVEYIGEEMQLMAFNAAINAAHCRGKGAGLQVIAEQIQALAEGAFAGTVTLTEECRFVADQVEELEKLDAVGNQLEKRLTELMAEGRSLFETLQENRRELTAVMRGVAVETDRFGEEVTACLATIDIRDRFHGLIAPLREGLRDLSSHCSPGLMGEESDARTHLFRKIHSRYTMYSERAIHDSLSAESQVVAQHQNVGESVADATAGHDLGDNVELF